MRKTVLLNVVEGTSCIIQAWADKQVIFGFLDFRRVFDVEYFLLGITPASELSESTFQNLVSVPSSWTRCVGVAPMHLVHEDGTDTRFRNVDSFNSDAGVIPKRKYSTIFTFFANSVGAYSWHLNATPKQHACITGSRHHFYCQLQKSK
jgi:hypothetical protein